MDYTFPEIVDGTLAVLQKLPTPIPAEGHLAGFERYSCEEARLLYAYDNSHYAMGDAFYRRGIRGIAEEAEEQRRQAATPQAAELLDGIARTYRELAAYCRRYAAAVAQAAGAGDGHDRSRLGRIADDLAWLADHPPRTFLQAVQLFYLMWSIRCLDHCACIGRLDVHLAPFYQADIRAHRLTREDALDLICELWERLNHWGSGDTLMNVMVGGRNPDGSDASSDVSVLLLEAGLRVGGTEPHLNVRYHRDIRPDLLEAAYRLQYQGHGQASIYNDEVILPEMARCGIPADIAHAYCNDGCTEIIWDGCGRIDFNHIDAVAALVLAMYNGRLPSLPPQEVRYVNASDQAQVYMPDVIQGFASGEAADCETYEAFYQMFQHQYRYQLRQKLDQLRELDRRYQQGIVRGLPFLNGTYEPVLHTGIGLTENGLPMNSYMVFLGSLPTVADCLAALRKVVYEERRFTLAQVRQAMEADFEGYAVLRAALLAAPKFGNDLDGVDAIAAALVEYGCDEVDRYRAETGFQVFPALIGWRFVEESYGITATPDGRRRKDPIAEHYCATPGKAVKGVTALVNSIAKAPLQRALGVAATHLSLPRNFAENEAEGLALLRTINAACIGKGLMEYNIAIYDADRLREAQRHPEGHEDLIVRVWGFCARFVDLSTEMQDHVIQRILSSRE